MNRGPFYQDGYRPQFSGHETFPLRYGWLKKSYDAVDAALGERENKSIFSDEAIARFGVGKNMVSSMRHWAIACRMLKEQKGELRVVPTALGRRIFSHDGLDPFLENPSTLWLIHWNLCSRPEKTTWYWVFNYFTSDTFHRDALTDALFRLSKERDWQRVSPATIKRDVECFVRTYVARVGGQTFEDSLESPLAELGLIKPIGKRDGFRMVRGPKTTLGDGVFLFALIDFWSKYTSASTLSVEVITYEQGSPGKVFLLDENSLIDRLYDIEDYTDGAYRYSETAGLKQIIRDFSLDERDHNSLIELDYPNT